MSSVMDEQEEVAAVAEDQDDARVYVCHIMRRCNAMPGISFVRS